MEHSRYNQSFHQYQQQQQPQPQQTTRVCYPQAASPNSMHSTYQSSTSVSSLASMSTSPSQTSMHSRQSPILSSAPLPSPNGERQPAGGNYFGVMQSSMSHSSIEPCLHQMQSISQQPQQQMSSHQLQGQRGGQGGGVPETAPYLQGFNLLAEAAKRAEMAVLMRDLNDFEM